MDISIPNIASDGFDEKEEQEGEAVFGVATHGSVVPISGHEQADALLYQPEIPVSMEHIAQAVFTKYQETMAFVIDTLPESRAKSLAKTALEESYLWAMHCVRQSAL